MSPNKQNILNISSQRKHPRHLNPNLQPICMHLLPVVIVFESFICILVQQLLLAYSINTPPTNWQLTINILSTMPCLYKMEIRDSPIQGKGFFALQDIPKGAVYWVWEDSNGPLPVEGYNVQPNRVYTKEQLYAVADHQKLMDILHGGFYYANADIFIELLDGTQFTNHSQDWNSQIIYDQGNDYRKMTCVARKAIKAGDEITGYYGNYLSTQAKWVNDLMEKYLPDRKNIENAVITGGNKALNWEIHE